MQPNWYSNTPCLSAMAIKTSHLINFMVKPCINNIRNFNFQLMHTMLKNIVLLKHFKISKTAPTICSHNTDNVLYGLYVSNFNQVCNF